MAELHTLTIIACLSNSSNNLCIRHFFIIIVKQMFFEIFIILRQNICTAVSKANANAISCSSTKRTVISYSSTKINLHQYICVFL